MNQEIHFTQEKHLGVITLNRVQALNALTLTMIKALQSQLQQWEEDLSIHAIVIQAAPGKAFCAGGDVRWLYDTGRNNDKQPQEFFWHEYRLNHYIHHLKKPYIALMNGITMGGGVGISLHGSHTVATEQFVFAMPETGIGFFPDIGASHLLSRMPDSFGFYLGLTGNRIGPQDAFKLGIVKHVVNAQDLPMLIEQLSNSDLSKNPHQKVDAIMETFSQLVQEAPVDKISSSVAEHFNQASIEEIFNNLENSNEWSQHTLSILQQKAPLSLKVTFEQLKKAETMDLANCLMMDFCLVRHFMKDHDFYEGVRALLVDKDKNPHWQPNHLKDVTKAQVMSYFENEPAALTFINE